MKGGDADSWAIVAPPKLYCYIFAGKILEERGGGGPRFKERLEKIFREETKMNPVKMTAETNGLTKRMKEHLTYIVCHIFVL